MLSTGLGNCHAPIDVVDTPKDVNATATVTYNQHLLSNIKEQISTFQEGWKTGRVEETPCSLSSMLPTFRSSNASGDQKRKFNIETCLTINWYRIRCPFRCIRETGITMFRGDIHTPKRFDRVSVIVDFPAASAACPTNL